MIKLFLWTLAIIVVIAYVMITRGPAVVIDPLVIFVNNLELP